MQRSTKHQYYHTASLTHQLRIDSSPIVLFARLSRIIIIVKKSRLLGKNNMSHEMPMMKMYFHFGFGDQFLFEHLHIDNTLKMWSVCGALFLLTLLFEAIKYIRCVHCGCQSMKSHHVSTENGDLPDNDTNIRFMRNCYVGRLRSSRHRFIQTLLHTAQTSLGFLLMLSVMSFNLCIIFAILVGK